MKKENRKNLKNRLEECTMNIEGNPETVNEMLNKYGTYEIQPTADTENEFPAVAQGKSEKKVDKSKN